jgi:hypothetical protein
MAAQSQPPLWLWAGWTTPGHQATCPRYPAKHGHMDQLTTCEISKFTPEMEKATFAIRNLKEKS